MFLRDGKVSEILLYLEDLAEKQKQESLFQHYILARTIPFLQRNGYYKEAVERTEMLLNASKENKQMCMYLQFNLGLLFKNGLQDQGNAIAAFKTFLENYEHDVLSPLAVIELEMMEMMDNGLARRTPQQSSTVEVPTSFTLSQNYPNPFNPQTTINNQLANECVVAIKIYNLLGHEVRTLVNERQSAGNYSLVWDGHDNWGQPVSSGVYVYRIAAGEFSEVRKMELLR